MPEDASPTSEFRGNVIIGLRLYFHFVSLTYSKQVLALVFVPPEYWLLVLGDIFLGQIRSLSLLYVKHARNAVDQDA